jgi:hypothetical protein
MLPPAVLTAVSILAIAPLRPNAASVTVSANLTDTQISAVQSRLADGAIFRYVRHRYYLSSPNPAVFPPLRSVENSVEGLHGGLLNISSIILRGLALCKEKIYKKDGSGSPSIISK